MYMNFWYPACQSSSLTEQPLKRKMLGLDFVLFRDASGRAHCLSNTCIHRGGSLGGGRVKGDCIQCPYHGWEFGGDGRCRKIPSLGPDAKIPQRARVVRKVLEQIERQEAVELVSLGVDRRCIAKAYISEPEPTATIDRQL